ncbi:hypothetical protein ACN38_g1175 [Penicillium nordicum]|uniref:Uncharacterized protein n=1 Tax=Penicillium nordicum TaxID=229535 RepID=A0A0M8PGS9_9EURO|nr:hypothetical protein ACN38_g1175 [Penicillium nordicum]
MSLMVCVVFLIFEFYVLRTLFYWRILLNLDGEVGVWPGKISWRDVGPNILCTEQDVLRTFNVYISITHLTTQIVYKYNNKIQKIPLITKNSKLKIYVVFASSRE